MPHFQRKEPEERIDPFKVIVQIEIAFPTNTTFNVHSASIGCGFSYEGRELDHALRGLKWDKVPKEKLAYFAGSWMFFSPEAYRYYLPAFMTASLSADDRFGILEHTVYGLCPPRRWDDVGATQRWLQRVTGFTHSQRTVIVLFLEYATWHANPLVPSDVGFDALEAYWYYQDGRIHW